MAWCPHCREDRPITQRTFTGTCSVCGQGNVGQVKVSVFARALAVFSGESAQDAVRDIPDSEPIHFGNPHAPGCRGPAPGVHDVCQYCGTKLFARAMTGGRYSQLVQQEELLIRLHSQRQRASLCRAGTLLSATCAFGIGMMLFTVRGRWEDRVPSLVLLSVLLGLCVLLWRAAASIDRQVRTARLGAQRRHEPQVDDSDDE